MHMYIQHDSFADIKLFGVSPNHHNDVVLYFTCAITIFFQRSPVL